MGKAAGGITVRTTVPLKYRLPKPGVAAKADDTGRTSAIARAEKSAMVKVFILTNSPPLILGETVADEILYGFSEIWSRLSLVAGQ